MIWFGDRFDNEIGWMPPHREFDEAKTADGEHTPDPSSSLGMTR